MPVALYPVYRTTAPGGHSTDYFDAYAALPFAPCGPLWFLGQLLALTILAVLLCHYARPAIDLVQRLTLRFEATPARAFSAWALISIAAYAPLALMFTPWRWENWGPFAVQLCRPALYALYYFAGLGVGAAGLGSGWLRADGWVAASWRRWTASAAASLFLWMALTGLTLRLGDASPFLLRLAADSSYALACACSAVSVIAVCLRFGASRPWPLVARFADNAYGVYVLHYAPIVWLQYALLGMGWPAPIKALVVLVGASAACLATTALGHSLLGVLTARRASSAA
jgi:hypothetical protein